MRRVGELAVHPRRSFAWVVLRHSPYSGIQIRSTSQHQLHQAVYPIRLLQLARTINTTSQVPHSVRCGFPVDTVPHALAFSRILYPLEISASLALGLLVSETPAGLPRSA